ncbi:WD40 repeat-like protein [Fistulina hepatica ATCC 64428]|nr:WD40 repeat-like protein [Fistulina hepatica ATCC 64428]
MESASTFVAPEGVYSLTEERKPSILSVGIHLANSTFPNPSTKVSTALVRCPTGKHSAAAGLAQLLGNAKRDKKDRDDNRREEPPTGPSGGGSLSSSDTPADPDGSGDIDRDTPGSPCESHALFSSAPSAGKKKHGSRPKHNMRTTNFITRYQPVDGLTRALQSRQGDITYMFYNYSKTIIWDEVGSSSKVGDKQEPLMRITFTAFPTCHDVNPTTASPDHLDIVVGFHTGDLIWIDPIAARYNRLNKQASFRSSPCTSVRWVPSSATLFLVSHADGTIVIYDTQREDGSFTPQEPSAESQDQWDPTDSMFVSIPPWHPDKSVKNPVSHWRLSKRSVVDFAFSPDVKYVGAISEDGCLRVIDTLAEQLVDCYASYFGALTCVAWSPDGRFILTGGQDDLLTIFSPWEQRVVARCQGHSSFVSAVAFDDLRCDGRTYRFGSVGEDNKLILWDFSSGVLHRPKHQNAHHTRMSLASTTSLLRQRERSTLSLAAAGMDSIDGTHSLRYHPAPSRNEIAVVQPVLVKYVECDLLADIAFLSRSVLTASRSGYIKLWIRPLALKPRVKHGHQQNTTMDVHDFT